MKKNSENSVLSRYAGIGPRTAPEWVLAVMRRTGRYMVQQGYLLRSGRAKGSDQAFEYGCDTVKGPKEIFLPDPQKGSPLQRILWQLATYANPRFPMLGEYKQYPLLRNPNILFGAELDTPVDLVLTWMPGEQQEWTGGTSNTLRLMLGYNAGNLPGQKSRPEKPIQLGNLAKEPFLLELLSKLEWDYGDLKKMYGLGVPTTKEVWTVGYGNYSWPQFEQLLTGHGIKRIIDVRSIPTSGRVEYRKVELEEKLNAQGILYKSLPALGGFPPRDRADLYEDGKPSYPAMTKEPELLKTLDTVIETLDETHTTLLCSERDYHSCHRSLLLAPLLRQRGVAVHHIITPREVQG